MPPEAGQGGIVDAIGTLWSAADCVNVMKAWPGTGVAQRDKAPGCGLGRAGALSMTEKKSSNGELSPLVDARVGKFDPAT
jgi:hypothetical protein